MKKWLFALLIITTTALMGSGFSIGKLGLNYSSPIFLAALRFTTAGFLMAVGVRLFHLPHPQRLVDWLKLILIGICQTAGVMGFLFMSLETISAGQSSILTFINPLIVVILATLLLKIKYSLRQWSGVLLGCLGIIIIFGGQVEVKIGTLYGFLSAVAWASGTLLINRWGKSINTWVLTAYQMFTGGVILLLLSWLLEEPYFEINWYSIGILTWLIILASIVQFFIWFYLLQHGDPGKISAFLFLAPFFGVLTGHFMLDEVIDRYVLMGACCIFLGIFLVNWHSKSQIIPDD